MHAVLAIVAVAAAESQTRQAPENAMVALRIRRSGGHGPEPEGHTQGERRDLLLPSTHVICRLVPALEGERPRDNVGADSGARIGQAEARIFARADRLVRA